MLEATIFFVIFAVIIGAVSYYALKKARKDPENAGLEPGALLVKSFIKYSLTYFIGLQFGAMVSEAALLASVQEPDINVAARMTVHMVMALISALAAFALTKYFGAFVSALISPRPFGVRAGLVVSLFFLSLISLLFTVGAPLYNLAAMTNSLKQSAQLEVWWAGFQVAFNMAPQSYLDYKIALNHLPKDYAPFASLHSGIVTSLGITSFHILVTLWEALTALMLALTNQTMAHAVLGDFFDIKRGDDAKDDDKNKDKDKDKDKDKKDDDDKDKANIKKAKETLSVLFEFCGISKVDDWVTKVLPHFYKPKDDNNVKRVAQSQTLRLEIEKLPAGKSRDQLIQKIHEAVSDWSNGGLHLPKK
jgi:hypothetical protein